LINIEGIRIPEINYCSEKDLEEMRKLKKL
jgi:hypothetical protein